MSEVQTSISNDLLLSTLLVVKSTRASFADPNLCEGSQQTDRKLHHKLNVISVQEEAYGRY